MPIELHQHKDVFMNEYRMKIPHGLKMPFKFMEGTEEDYLKVITSIKNVSGLWKHTNYNAMQARNYMITKYLGPYDPADASDPQRTKWFKEMTTAEHEILIENFIYPFIFTDLELDAVYAKPSRLLFQEEVIKELKSSKLMVSRGVDDLGNPVEKLFAMEISESTGYPKTGEILPSEPFIVATQGGGGGGQKGDKGDTGAQGVKGDTGSTGQVGADGATGLQGVAGTDGTDGATGSTGATGAKGDTGNQGLQGEVGLQGLAGEPGKKGDDSTVPGPQGEKGFIGPHGPTGPMGSKGDQGNQGIQGVMPGFRGALVWSDVDKVVPNDGPMFRVDWNRQSYDQALFWFPEHPAKLAIPAGVSWVILRGQIVWEPRDGGVRSVELWKNDYSTGGRGMGASRIQASTNGATIQSICSAPIPVVQNDRFELWVYQDAGIDQKIISEGGVFSWFSIEALR